MPLFTNHYTVSRPSFECEISVTDSNESNELLNDIPNSSLSRVSLVL